MNPQNYTGELPKPLKITKQVAKVLSIAFIGLGLAFAIPSGLFFPVLMLVYLFTPVGWIAAATILVWVGIKGYESYLDNPRGFFNFSIGPTQSVVLVLAILFLLFVIFIVFRPF